MVRMEFYSKAAMERAMKVQEVILRAMAKKITWWQAAEIIGLSDRSMRRWRQRYEEYGYDGLLDRRRGKPSRDGYRWRRWRRCCTLSGEVCRPERAALSREAEAGPRDRTELHLGEAGAARIGSGEVRSGQPPDCRPFLQRMYRTARSKFRVSNSHWFYFS